MYETHGGSVPRQICVAKAIGNGYTLFNSISHPNHMKITTRILALCFVIAGTVLAQDSPFSRMEIMTSLDRPPVFHRTSPAALVDLFF